jgi:uncharacterized protein YecE (DUF72 family)
MKDQLSLFSGGDVGAGPGPARVKCVQFARDAELAAALPSLVRFGTSSWTFPGWANHFYEPPVAQKDLVHSGLQAYAQNPLFSAVGLDRSYYGPVPRAELDAYARDLPAPFRVLSKVWNEVTTYIFPDHPSAGDRAGKRNPNFLNPEIVLEEILPAYRGDFAKHAGALIFEIPPIAEGRLPDPRELTDAMTRLLSRLPSGFSYAFEPRNIELVTPRYLDVLRVHHAAHVLLYWSGVPPLVTQLKIPSILPSPVVIARIMQPPRTRYEQLREAFAPFDHIVRADEGMREDIVRLARMCMEAGKKELFLTVGNKAEGCAPLTVRALAEKIVGSLQGSEKLP